MSPLPSPSTSPAASVSGLSARGTFMSGIGLLNVPSPLPSATTAISSDPESDTRSSLPSPSKSAAATLTGFTPMLRALPAMRLALSLPHLPDVQVALRQSLGLVHSWSNRQPLQEPPQSLS